jgi:hypothetical protein
MSSNQSKHDNSTSKSADQQLGYTYESVLIDSLVQIQQQMIDVNNLAKLLFLVNSCPASHSAQIHQQCYNFIIIRSQTAPDPELHQTLIFLLPTATSISTGIYQHPLCPN